MYSLRPPGNCPWLIWRPLKYTTENSYTHTQPQVHSRQNWRGLQLKMILLNCWLCSQTACVQFAIKWKYVLVIQERKWSWRTLSSLESEDLFCMAIILYLKLIKRKSEQTSECWFVCTSLNPHKKWFLFFLVKCIKLLK